MRRSKSNLDLAGQKMHRITFLHFVSMAKNGHAIWRVRCDCGTEFEAFASNVKRGNTKSCGCLRVETCLATLKTMRSKKP